MKGITAERKVAKYLKELGFLVASRRHFGGAGDILALPPSGVGILVEVKASSSDRGPFADFPPKDREAMMTAGKEHDVVPLLAWLPEGGKMFFIPRDEWPG